MNKIYLEVTAKDTLLFRDTMSMDMGTTNFIESMAMPYPSVIYGMLTTALMREGFLEELKSFLNRKPDSLLKREKFLAEHLHVNSLYLSYDGELFIPAPLDLFVDGDGKVYMGEYEDGLLYPPKKNGEKLERAEGMFISFNDFRHHYVYGDLDAVVLRKESYFFGDYFKAGIAIDKQTKAAAKEMLYFAKMREPKTQTAYFAEAEIKEDILKEGTWRADVSLGGRNRTAYLRQLPEDDYRIGQKETYKNGRVDSKFLKMIFTTPYIMDEADAMEKNFENQGISVVTRVTGKPLVIGGYDMAAGRRKKLQTALPAGSLYLLSSEAFVGKTLEQVQMMLLDVQKSESGQTFRGFGKFILAETEAGDGK